MEALIRKPYQGVWNIIRFNWHFYGIAAAVVTIVFTAGFLLGDALFWICFTVVAGIIASTLLSLLVSHYVYDLSGFYNFDWLKEIDQEKPHAMVNIHAGFDETSAILNRIFPSATMRVFDFYDPKKHTEVSIERARRAYPPFEGTVKITTDALPSAVASTDLIFNIFALHEIRDRTERIQFLRKQASSLKGEGKCIIVEHLRDLPNFLAYTIGFFHFFPEAEWTSNFSRSGLAIERQFRITPFVSVFILKKTDGNTP